MTVASYLERQVAVGDLKLHYQEWGDPARPTILMVHGFGVSGHMFDEFADRAQSRFHLIALDQRGHGDSDWATDGDYSREAFVNDIEGFREALGLETFILMGHSMGGLNAVSYAIKHPERVNALVLVDVGPEAAKEGVDNIVRFTRGPDELDFDEFVDMAHRFNPRRSMENIRERMRHRLKPTESGKWTWKFDSRFRSDRDSLRVGSEMSNDDTWALFRSVPVPTLIVRGAESDVLGQEVAERAANEMQRAELVVVPDAGHSVPGDNPDDFAAVTLRFIDDLAEAGTTELPGSTPPPIDELVRENESRKRGSTGTLLLVAGGAALAAVGLGFLFASARKRKKQRRRDAVAARARQAAPAVDLSTLQSRLSGLAAELADLGKTSATRARAIAAEPHVESALEQARVAVHDVADRGRHAAHNVDGRRVRRGGKWVVEHAAPVAKTGAGAVTRAKKRRGRRRTAAQRMVAWLR